MLYEFARTWWRDPFKGRAASSMGQLKCGQIYGVSGTAQEKFFSGSMNRASTGKQSHILVCGGWGLRDGVEIS